jgi:hypothetical protein
MVATRAQNRVAGFEARAILAIGELHPKPLR